jgi:hypothetical protein
VITNQLASESVKGELLTPEPMTYALVQSSGLVTIVYSLSSLTTKCSLNVFKFPFDQQTCKIAIGSWAMSIDKLDFGASSEPIGIEHYIQNPVWDLVQTSYDFYFAKDRYSYDRDYYDMEEVSFSFTLKRRPLYFMINNVFPCLVLNLITVMSFFLPTMPQFTISKDIK